MKHCFAPLLAVSALLGLAACGDDSDQPTTFCPQPAALEQAAAVTLFLPGRQDVAAQITTARITGIAGSCTLNEDKNLLRLTFRAGFSASNGPANHQATLTLPYFVALAQGDQTISKTPYSVTFNFSGNVSAASATSKPVTVELANVPASATTEVLVGFQMTQAQLDYTAAHPAGP